MTKQIDLSDFFITKKQANNFIQSLNNIIDQLFEVNFNIETALSNEFGMDKKDKFMNLLRENNMNNTTNDSLKKFLTELQNNARSLPVITLTIAYEPNEASLKAILEWFLISLKKQILLDIQVDKRIIAGATVNFNGKFKDYSVKTLFDNLISQQLNNKTATKQT